MDLGRRDLKRIEEKLGQAFLSVVKLRELHHLEVGIGATSEDRREVGGRLAGGRSDRQDRWREE